MTTTSGGRPSGEATAQRDAGTRSTGTDGAGTSARAAAVPAPPGTVIAPSAGGQPLVRQRRVRMTITRVDPWTVLRLSFLLSIAAAVITVVALMLLWAMLSAGGVFTSVDGTLESVLGDGALTITQYFSFGRVLSISLLIGAVDVVLFTALATIGAFLFNLTASLVGGLEVSGSEDA